MSKRIAPIERTQLNDLERQRRIASSDDFAASPNQGPAKTADIALERVANNTLGTPLLEGIVDPAQLEGSVPVQEDGWELTMPKPAVSDPAATKPFSQALDKVTGLALPVTLFSTERMDAKPIQRAQSAAFNPSKSVEKLDDQINPRESVMGLNEVNIEDLGIAMALSNLTTFKANLEGQVDLLKSTSKAEAVENLRSLDDYKKDLEEAQASQAKAHKGFFGRLFSGLWHVVTGVFNLCTGNVAGFMSSFARALGQWGMPQDKLDKFLQSKFMKGLQWGSLAIMGMFMMTSGVGVLARGAGKLMTKKAGQRELSAGLRSGERLAGQSSNLAKSGAKLTRLGEKLRSRNLLAPFKRLGGPSSGTWRDLFTGKGIDSKWTNLATKRSKTLHHIAQTSDAGVHEATIGRQKYYSGLAASQRLVAEAKLEESQTRQHQLRTGEMKNQSEIEDRISSIGATLSQASADLAAIGRVKSSIASKRV